MQNNDILELFNQLTDFQKERIQRELRSYIQFNEFVESSHYAHCPVCGIAEPKIIKKGFLNGKQRVECQSCIHKIVQTRGKLRYNSHQSEAQWSILIVDTLNAIPLVKTAAELDVSTETVFHMRHKFLLLLEQLLYEQPITLEGIIEMDETYINDGFKGIKRTSGRKARKHGERAQKRGLSEEKLCIFMGTYRLGQELVQCVNRAKPSSKEVIQVFGSVIKEQSILINDGLFSNYDLIQQNKLTSMVVSDHQTFTPVIHLNTVNSMHSGFKKLYRHYRGVSTKYLSRYLALYIFMRRFMGMDDQEKLMVFLSKTKETLASFTKVMVKSQNLLLI